MARRSDRTTGLPRPRRRERPPSRGRTVAGIPWNDRSVHLAVISAAAALLAIVVMLAAASVYHDRWGHGREVILRVGTEEFTLNYFADRYFDYATSSPTGAVTIDIGLMGQLEREGILLLLARERGVDLSDAAIDRQIAADLGIVVGGDGTTFDRAVRNELRTSQMSLATYRRKEEARAAETGLRASLREEVGTRGELLTLRVVVLSTKDAADNVRQRILAGENMGTIAQTESIDLVSKAEDGLREPTPPDLLEAVIKEALAGKGTGETVGPVPVNDSEYWVIRVEARDTGDYSDIQASDLAGIRLDQVVAAKRATTTIRRSADAGDLTWASEKAGS